MQVDVYGDTLCALVSATALASTGNQVQLHLPAGPHAEQRSNLPPAAHACQHVWGVPI